MSSARGVARFRAGEMAEKMRLPLIIKPVDGVGCEGVNFSRMPPYSNSYTGRRRVVNINLAQAIRGGPIQEVLPQEVSLFGRSISRKEDLI